MILFCGHLMCSYYLLGPMVTHFTCTVTLAIDVIMSILQMRKLNHKEFNSFAQSHVTSKWGKLNLKSLPEPRADQQPCVGFQDRSLNLTLKKAQVKQTCGSHWAVHWRGSTLVALRP